MSTNEQPLLPKREEPLKLTDGFSGVPDCTKCGGTAYEPFYIARQPYCVDCYLEIKHPGKRMEELPPDVYSAIFD